MFYDIPQCMILYFDFEDDKNDMLGTSRIDRAEIEHFGNIILIHVRFENCKPTIR